MGLASLPRDRRADRDLLGQGRHSRLAGRQRRHRVVDRCLRGHRSVSAVASRPAASCQRACIASEERPGQLLCRRFARRLLLGLGGQAARLRSELAEDVLDARQVRLRLDQLLLGPPSSPLMAPDAGNLLEQRPALLGAERQGLVDHPLADEQEGVVGKVGRIEQVDQVAQADPALVQEVVVLARAVEAPPELEHAEIDRQQAIGVVEDERDVGHPLGRALVRACPDDVLGLARAERPTLLPERPAQRVGEVALARSVRPDDGADPRASKTNRSRSEQHHHGSPPSCPRVACDPRAGQLPGQASQSGAQPGSMTRSSFGSASIFARSSSVSSKSKTSKFSTRRSWLDALGMVATFGLSSSQRSATWPAVFPCASPIARSVSSSGPSRGRAGSRR